MPLTFESVRLEIVWFCPLKVPLKEYVVLPIPAKLVTLFISIQFCMIMVLPSSESELEISAGFTISAALATVKVVTFSL